MRTRKWFWIIVAVIVGLGIACYSFQWLFIQVFPTIMQPSFDEWFRELLVTQNDLPFGWRPTTLQERKKEGVEAHVFMGYTTHSSENDPVQSFIQELSLYKNSDDAANAYTEEVIALEEIRVLMPTDDTWHADQLYLGCSTNRMNQGAVLCDVIGQYETVISQLGAYVFEDHSLTYEEFIFAAHQADERIADHLGLEP